MNTTRGCPLVNLFNVVSKMWVMHIIRVVFLGNNTFSDIQANLGTISSKTLSARLKELQNEGFINRKLVSEQPIKIRYELTDKGLSFSKEIDKLGTWAGSNGF